MWYPDYLVGSIISTIVEAILFLVGLFINIKIAILEWKNREAKTWQVQIVYSVCGTIYFAFELPFSSVSNAIPNISEYTGDWFCNLATFIITYGIIIFTTNSLLVSIMKYTFIVHPFKVLKWGHEKIQKIFLATYLAVPFVMAVIQIATKDFESYTNLRMCFGLKNEDLVKNTWKRLFLCNLKEMGIDASANIHLGNSIQLFCVLKQIIAYIITSNIMEAFFYRKIFTKMKRCIIIYHIFFLRIIYTDEM
jgi:hypothetical protein